MPVPHHGLTEYEFEEIMARNKTVATSAISRAVEVPLNHVLGPL